MMESGAERHAANRTKDLANVQTKKTKNPMRCVLADGKEIQSKGIIKVEAEIDDETHMMPFDQPVPAPLVAVRDRAAAAAGAADHDGVGALRVPLSCTSTRARPLSRVCVGVCRCM